MDKKLIKQASKHLKPTKVLLSNSNIKTLDQTDLDTLPYEVETYRSTSELIIGQSDEQDGPIQFQYLYKYDVGIRGIKPDSENSDRDIEPIFEITATFKAFYISETELTEESATEFGKFNVGHTVWPYWREYVHSTSARIGLAPVEVPFYSISK